jgi:hypothetical protein
MDCRKCGDDLTAFIDGEIAGSAAERMKQHLENCSPCRDEFKELKDSAALVESHSGALELDPEIWNNLRARIAEMPAPGDSSGLFRFLVVNRWTTAAATLAATVILSLGLWIYVQYQASEREFQLFVKEYIQTRSAAEQVHSLQLLEAAEKNPFNLEGTGLITTENPFADPRTPEITNPFRSEER